MPQTAWGLLWCNSGLPYILIQLIQEADMVCNMLIPNLREEAAKAPDILRCGGLDWWNMVHCFVNMRHFESHISPSVWWGFDSLLLKETMKPPMIYPPWLSRLKKSLCARQASSWLFKLFHLSTFEIDSISQANLGKL